MNRAPSWLQEVEKSAEGRTVLLVEGSDDNVILSYFFEKHCPGWDQRIFVGEAGGKPQVIQGLKHRPHWVGIVDNDIWTPAEAHEAQRETPRLRVLPRFCIESFFCVPEELWPALPQNSRDAVSNDVDRLKQPILDVLPDWVAHGAMYRILQARATGVRSRCVFPHALQDSPVTDEGEIRKILETWHQYLEPDDILAEYREEKQRGLALSIDEQLAFYVVGDKFFEKVIAPTLDGLFGATGKNWLHRFRDEKIHPPTDLVHLLDETLSLI